jgi:hypothetical protein
MDQAGELPPVRKLNWTNCNGRLIDHRLITEKGQSNHSND